MSEASPPEATGRPVAVTVEEVLSTDAEVARELARLVTQLSTSAPALTEEQVASIVESPATVLFIARGASGRVVGSLTLVLFRVPSGLRAWIEDVIVDTEERGGGIGSALVRAAIERAEDAGARTVDLSSRPSRVEANRLYLKLGFEQRETNMYRFNLAAG